MYAYFKRWSLLQYFCVGNISNHQGVCLCPLGKMVTYQRRLCLIYNILDEFNSCRIFKVKYAQENISLHIIIVIHPKFKV